MSFAWGELFDLPLQFIFREKDAENGRNVFTLAAFPLLGFLVGTLTALFSLLVGKVFNSHAGGIVFALIGWLILCFKDSGRGDSWLGNYFFGKLQNPDNRDFARNILNIFPVLLKFALLLFIGLAGGTFYLALLLAGAFALQAALISSEDCTTEFVPVNDASVIIFRSALVVLGIIGFALCRLGAVGAVAVVCGLYIVYNRKFVREGFSADGVSRAGYVAEWLLLTAGLLLQ